MSLIFNFYNVLIVFLCVLQRSASIYGDIRFQSHRRLMLDAIVEHTANQTSTINVPAWGYLYAQHDPGAPPSVGVPHTSDLNCSELTSTFISTYPRPLAVFFSSLRGLFSFTLIFLAFKLQSPIHSEFQM